MIHCSLAHSGNWGVLAGHLSGALSMTAFDMPGHGRSGDWDNRHEYQGVVTGMAADFLRAPTDVIGHSFGATVALRLAIEHPEYVRSLVLIEPVFFAIALKDRPWLAGAHEQETDKFNQAMAAGDRMAAAAEFTALWGDGMAWEEIPAAQRLRLADQIHLIGAGATALYDGDETFSNGDIERVSKPVLLIEGSGSPTIISAIHDGLAARLPQAKRSVIIGATHMVPMTHARQVSAEILQFYRQC